MTTLVELNVETCATIFESFDQIIKFFSDDMKNLDVFFDADGDFINTKIFIPRTSHLQLQGTGSFISWKKFISSVPKARVTCLNIIERNELTGHFSIITSTLHPYVYIAGFLDSGVYNLSRILYTDLYYTFINYDTFNTSFIKTQYHSSLDARNMLLVKSLKLYSTLRRNKQQHPPIIKFINDPQYDPNLMSEILDFLVGTKHNKTFIK
jgi:hypothetical protein